jgi:outer membrane immunogenic protein
MMKKLSLAFVVLASSNGFASAGEPPSHNDPTRVPPSPSWTGVYAGLNAGGTWSANGPANIVASPAWTDLSYSTALGSNYASARAGTGPTPAGFAGFIGGGQIGYNWRVYDSVVASLEADIQGLASSGDRGHANRLSPTPSGNFWLAATGVTAAPAYIGTVRTRLGLLVTPSLFVFGSGGLAYGCVGMNTNVIQIGLRASPETFTPPGMFSAYRAGFTARAGWTIGGGAEWMFSPSWSLKA